MKRLTEEKQIGPFASLKDKAESVPGAFSTYDCFYAHEIAVTKLKQYEDTGFEPDEIMELINPSTPPMTLEELREIGVTAMGTSAIEGYGKTWRAYRRKPEEGTHE